jgi:hypothetical protein
LLYLPVGVFCDFDGTKVLNKTRIRVIEPSNPQCDARLPWNSPEVARAFPFLHGLFDHLLAKIPIPGWEEGSPTQVDYLIWHMARFYRSGYYRRGGKGHALFIAGGAGQGKSLFAEIIYPRLMGGVGRDAFSFISGKTKWSGGLANLPVLSINDGAAYKGGIANVIGDALKKVTADGTMESNVKFGNEGFVKWRGRFIVTLNTDHDSTRILPTINNSVRDKFIYLLAESNDENKYEAFGTEEENERRIMAELPIFARYLLDCYVPVEGDPWFDKRFGFKAWQHPTLLDRSSLDDRSACLIDAFEELWGCAPKTDKRGKKLYWEGSAATLYRMLSWGGGDAVHGNESFRKTFTTPQSLGRALASSVEKGYDIKDTTKGKRPSKTWRVSYDVYLDSAEAEQAVATPAPVVAQVPVAVRDAEPEPVPDEVVIIDGVAVRKAKGQPA